MEIISVIPLDIIEIISLGLGILYVILLSKEVIWAWPVGILSSAFPIVLFWEAKLYNEIFLYLVYIILGLYGWYYWLVKRANKKELPIGKITGDQTIIFCFLGLTYTLRSGYIMSIYTTSDVAYLDAFTTGFGLIGTYMQAKKILENWILWFFLNLITSFLYFYKGLQIYFILYIIYATLSVLGYIQWRNSYQSTHLHGS